MSRTWQTRLLPPHLDAEERRRALAVHLLPRAFWFDFRSVGGVIRLGTWNMNISGYDRWAEASLPLKWQTLVGLRQDADVMLVQEARPPVHGTWHGAGISAWPPLTDRIAWRQVTSGASPAGVVLLSGNLALRPIEVQGPARSHEGTLAICDVLRDGEPLVTVASAYGMFEEGAVSERSMRAVVEDLRELFAEPGSRIVLGGDFNMWIQPWMATPMSCTGILSRAMSREVREACDVRRVTRCLRPCDRCLRSQRTSSR
jgi:endonuclease/exonuclease/phosphatase family metal-dependent hydrolase